MSTANTIDDGTTGAEVLTEVLGNVLLIVLNRPTAGNSINAALALDVENALLQLDTDPELRVGIVTGAGNKMFCAGADLKALAAGESLFPDRDVNRGMSVLFRHAVHKPLIAAVNGAALGGGTEIALACDLVVASEDAMFGLPEVTRGLVAAGGGALRLPRQISLKLAMGILLLGSRIDAQTAASFSLVNRVVLGDQVRAEALKMAEVIAADAPLAVQASKRIALEGMTFGVMQDPELWSWRDGVARSALRSRDAREGPRAFAEKRAPQWTGS